MVHVVKQTVHTKLLHYCDDTDMSVLLRFFPYGKIKRLENGSLIWITRVEQPSTKGGVVVINNDTYVAISSYDKSCIFGCLPETVSLIPENEFEKTMEKPLLKVTPEVENYSDEEFEEKTLPTAEEASDDDMFLINNQMSYYVFSPPEEKIVILKQLRRRINFTVY